MAKAYRVYYAIHDTGGRSYLVNHSSFFYLIDPQGRFVDAMAGDLSGDGIAVRIDHFINKIG